VSLPRKAIMRASEQRNRVSIVSGLGPAWRGAEDPFNDAGLTGNVVVLRSPGVLAGNGDW
jgi:hypothetical protein